MSYNQASKPMWNFKHGIKQQHFSNSSFWNFHVISVVFWADFNENKPKPFPFTTIGFSLQLQSNARLSLVLPGYAMSLYEVNLDASVKRILRLSNSTSLSTVRVPWLFFVFLWIIPPKKTSRHFCWLWTCMKSAFFLRKNICMVFMAFGLSTWLTYAHLDLVEVIDLRRRPKVSLVWEFSRSWLNNLVFENWHGHLNISANCNSTKNRLSLFWIYQFFESMFVQWSGAMHAVGCHFFTTSGLCHHSCWVWILEQSCLLQVLLFFGDCPNLVTVGKLSADFFNEGNRINLEKSTLAVFWQNPTGTCILFST